MVEIARTAEIADRAVVDQIVVAGERATTACSQVAKPLLLAMRVFVSVVPLRLTMPPGPLPEVFAVKVLFVTVTVPPFIVDAAAARAAGGGIASEGTVRHRQRITAAVEDAAASECQVAERYCSSPSPCRCC